MEEQELLREMESQNKWWAEKQIKLEEGLIERGVYKNVLGEIGKKEVTGFIGLRRVGKTTILKQIIGHLLAKGVSEKNILLFSFDGFKKEEKAIKQVIVVYSKYVLGNTLEKTADHVYVFFDEVQKVSEWGEELKSIYDKDYKIKFFVSGSSSMNIIKGSGESLVGRIIFHNISPFTFREFLLINGIETEKQDLLHIKYPTGSEQIQILFNRYLKLGGFPELYKIPEQEIKVRLKTYLDLTFFRDIVNMFEVKRPDILEGLFFSVLKESGNLVNYNNLSKSLSTRFETIKSYMSYLSASYLISESRFFSNSRKSVEKNPKAYVADHSFSAISSIEEGLRAETVVYNHCKIIVYTGLADSLAYWRDRKNEVDIILSQDGQNFPIEIKYRNDPEDTAGLLKFMWKFKVEKGFVVTRDLFKTKVIGGKTVIFIPCWLFLLAV